MIAFRLPLLILMACEACDGCKPRVTAQPPPENGDPVDPGDDIEDSGDTQDTDTPVDTQEPGPAPCPQPEVEPNDPVAGAQQIDMYYKVCASFDHDGAGGGDLDLFGFETTEGGWIEVGVRANDIGSAADITALLNNDEYGTFWAERGASSNDPRAVFPLTSFGDWEVLLADQRQGSGEAFFYELMISVAKAPVEWDATVIEPNNTFDEAMAMTADQVVFGVMEDSVDRDNFTFTVPPGDDPDEEVEVTVSVGGWSHGSPIQPRLARSERRESEVYVPGEEPGDTGYFETEIEYETVINNYGGQVTQPDARLTVIRAPGEVLYYTVRDGRDYFGPAFWYTITVTAGPPAPEPVDSGVDTGGDTDTGAAD
jgi:hypothetical protein